MTSELFIDCPHTCKYSELIVELEKLLGEKLKFKFLIVDILENNTNPLVKHPDILSSEPVVNGECQIHIHFVETDEKRLSNKMFTNPTWKELLLEINSLLNFNEVADLHNLEIQGILMSGNGYHVGALVTLNYA